MKCDKCDKEINKKEEYLCGVCSRIMCYDCSEIDRIRCDVVDVIRKAMSIEIYVNKQNDKVLLDDFNTFMQRLLKHGKKIRNKN